MILSCDDSVLSTFADKQVPKTSLP